MKKFYSLLLFVFIAQFVVAQDDCNDLSGQISPSNAEICAGESVQLTITSNGNNFDWFLNGVLIEGEHNSTLNATQEGTYSATVKKGNCEKPTDNSTTVDVNPLPSGSISPASASICQGGEVILTATGGDSYTWFRNGNEINGENNSTLEVDEPGTYSVIIHLNDCSAPASNSSTVTVASTPSGNISPASTTICNGESVTLTATGGTSYTWFRNGDEIAGVTDATLEVTQDGTYTVTIHQGDCSGPASNSSVVTVTTAPSGSISPTSGTICAGESITLTATGGSSYTWFRNGIQINGQDDATISVEEPGTYSVTIHQGDCSAPASNTATITVTPAPTGSISPASSSICPGGSQVLTATGGTSYTWFRDGVIIPGETDATLIAVASGTYSVTIHEGDCSGPASNTAVVTVGTTPTGTISPASGTICEGGSLTLVATGGNSYSWFKDGAEIPNEHGTTLEVDEPGTYSAIIRQGLCSGPASNTSVITLASAPTGTISPASGSICEGGSLVLTATGGTSYTWFRNGTVINNQTEATLNVSEPGTYTATIRQGDCSGPASNSSVITLASAPSGSIAPATASICEGGSVLLTASGGTSYAWFRNGVLIPGQNGSTLSVTESGTYSATIKQGDCSGPASNTAVVTFSSAPSGTISPATAAICGGSTQVLTATGGTSYTWMRDGVVIPGEESATISVSEPGTYSAIIKNGTCTGPASNTAIVTSQNATGIRYEEINATANAPVQLSAREIGVAYEWSPAVDLDNPTSRTPTVTTNSNREYVVRITTEKGCVIADTVFVRVAASKRVIFVPTAFTPNGNGANDVLRPLGDIQTMEYFRVYNRWGQLMFQTKELGVGWDGRFKGVDQPADTYTWIMLGTDTDGAQIKISGKTLLIR
jgi:trimeric autotransporter adhesin